MIKDENGYVNKQKFFAQAPRDPFKFAYFAFFMQGVAMFLAWNGTHLQLIVVFFTAAEFFSFRFSGSLFASNYSNYFSFSFMTGNMFFVTLATLRQHKVSHT